MKKTFGKALVGAIIGSFLMIGSAFALPVYYSSTDFTTDEDGTVNLSSGNLGDYEFGIYWVDDITGTPPVVTQTLPVNFQNATYGNDKLGQLEFTAIGDTWNVKNYFMPGDGVTDVPNLFGFYFQKNRILIVTGIKETDSAYTFTDGEGGYVIVDDITPTANAPVPEPATMLLFGAGLVGIVGAVRRKARK